MERSIGTCRICGESYPVRNININLYVGSEGLWACEMCEIAIVHYVRDMISIAGITRKAGYKACKEVREAKEAQKEKAEKILEGYDKE